MKELVLDISVYDEGIDLSAWKENRGLFGVIIKAGGNEDAVGGRYMDRLAKTHYRAAKAAGLHIGFYYYTDIRDVAVANRDANHFAQLIKEISNNDYDLPCYMDVEDPRQFNLGARKLTDVIKSFCDTLIYNGYYAGLYTGGSAWINNMYSDELTCYANWIASWGSNWPTYAGDIGMWQQGGMNLNGDIVFDDVNGYHDLDWCCIDYPSRIKNGQNKQEESTSEPSGEIQNGSPEGGMGRASDVINAAYGELGYYAPNDPERGSKYGRWLAEVTGEDWLAGPSTEIWWCCMFASWCLDQGGVVMDGFPTQNTDLALNGGARKYAVDIYDVRYGDIVIFNWDWDNATDHIGFATGEFDGNGFTTIEGNIGNAVCEKYRQMGNVAYVLRPPYKGYGVVGDNVPSASNEPKNNRDGGKLDVDGIGGWNTIIDWQNQLGTYEDGWISGQNREDRQYHSGMSNVDYDDDIDGSVLVRAIQEFVGAYVDGHWGPQTSYYIQTWLIKHGYDCGEAGADSDFGRYSVMGLQRALNDGAFKQ